MTGFGVGAAAHVPWTAPALTFVNSTDGAILSNTNRTISGDSDGSSETGRSSTDIFIDGGKYYWETVITSINSNYIDGDCRPGIYRGSSTADNEPNFCIIFNPSGTNLFNHNGNGTYYSVANYTPSIGGIINGDVFMWALDLVKYEMYVGKNGIWYNSSDPTTGFNPCISGIFPGQTLSAAWKGYTTSDVMTFPSSNNYPTP